MLPRFALPTLAPAIVLLAAAPAGAQSAALLPSAPEPHTILAASPAAALSNPDKPSQPSPQPPRQPVVEPSDPMLTLFPHREDAQWWLSGQANIIFQGHLPFHSPYEGTNSFRNAAEYKTSLLGTLYTAWRPTHSIRYNTDLILDLESAGGRGLSRGAGAGRLHQPRRGAQPQPEHRSLSGPLSDSPGHRPDRGDHSARSPASSRLAPSVPVRRIEFRVGKMTLPDFFDVNDLGSDSHLQFMNWTVDNNGAWDYAADTRGYTVGGMAEYDDRVWSLRYGTLRHAHRGQRHRHGLGLQPRPRPERRVRAAPQLRAQPQRRAAPALLRQPRPHGRPTARPSRPSSPAPTPRPTSRSTSTSARSSTASATTPSRR